MGVCYRTSMGEESTGLWRKLADSIRKSLSSALTKEENVETPGDQETYDPGARRGSNYKTPMERCITARTARIKRRGSTFENSDNDFNMINSNNNISCDDSSFLTEKMENDS